MTAAPATSREIQEHNRQSLIAYFASGAKPAGYPPTLGLELEHFVLTDDGLPVTYDGTPGVRDLLAELVATGAYPHGLATPDGQIIGAAGTDGVVSLEPAAQVEISLAPFDRIKAIEGAYQRFRQAVDPALARSGAHLVAVGYHPTRRARELALIPKDRYHYMDDYFGQLGTHGERMMRATASTQVSVNYSSEADAVRKLRVASALAPVLAAITSNTQVFEGVPTRGLVTRLEVWRDVDPARCGQIPGLFEPGFGFGSYADWLLGISPIFVPRPSGVRSCFATASRDAYADTPMTTDNVEHLISMVWPDVRLKRYVEIRPADSLPAPLAMGYVALVKGLMYSDDSLLAIEEALGVVDDHWPLDAVATDRAIAAIRRDGERALVHGVPLTRWRDLLFDVGAAALDAEERPYLDALREVSFGRVA